MSFNANSSNDLPFQVVIWIKSDGSPTGIPAGAYAFFESDTLPSNWSRVQAGSYLKGAAAAGDGGATGGALTHTHVSAAHTHGQDAHTHPDCNSEFEVGASTQQPINDGLPVLQPSHYHSLTISSATATNQSTTNTTNAENHEPVYKKLNTIRNDGAASLPDSVIALWAGTNASIPPGWTRYTAMDGYFLKGAAGGDGLTTGGSLTHTHTATCQPIQNNHVHTITQTGSFTFANLGAEILSGGVIRQTVDHAHSWTDSGNVTTNQELTYNVNACTSEAAYPPYVRLIYIQLTPAPTPARGGVYTSYSTGRFLDSFPRADVPDEVGIRIAHGDRRFTET